MKAPIFKSLTFWTLLVGLIAFVVRFYQPEFPLSEVNILALVLFALGLIGVVPSFKAHGFQRAFATGIVNVLAFWQLIAGFVIFVITYFAPTFPFTTETLLGVILFVLSFFGIKPELRAKGFKGFWQ
jgi:uncharacterized membrane protein YqjE